MTIRYLPLAACIAALLVGFGHAAVTAGPEYVCTTMDVSGDTDAGWAQAQELIEAGWTGRAGDGAERLYSPECVDPR